MVRYAKGPGLCPQNGNHQNLSWGNEVIPKTVLVASARPRVVGNYSPTGHVHHETPRLEVIDISPWLLSSAPAKCIDRNATIDLLRIEMSMNKLIAHTTAVHIACVSDDCALDFSQKAAIIADSRDILTNMKKVLAASPPVLSETPLLQSITLLRTWVDASDAYIEAAAKEIVACTSRALS